MTMRNVAVVGKTRTQATDFAARLEPGVRARIVTAKRGNVDGMVADHWIILYGVPDEVTEAIRYTAAKNNAPVTHR